jgi:hypothetical protein
LTPDLIGVAAGSFDPSSSWFPLSRAICAHRPGQEIRNQGKLCPRTGRSDRAERRVRGSAFRAFGAGRGCRQMSGRMPYACHTQTRRWPDTVNRANPCRFRPSARAVGLVSLSAKSASCIRRS